MTNPVRRIDIENYVSTLLSPFLFDDQSVNGLQVEGTDEVRRIAFAVSATRDSILKAAEGGADTLIVHHGILWKYQGARTITGPFYKRIAPLVQNNMNLLGYHLPLDAHFEIGNAACVAKLLKLENLETFAPYKKVPIGIKGKLATPMKASEFRKVIKNTLNHEVIMASPSDERMINSIGIITGGASNSWVEAVNEKVDAFLTGEISEHAWNDSQEAEVTMYAAGHYATELFGIKELQKKIKENFAVETFFIDSENPV